MVNQSEGIFQRNFFHNISFFSRAGASMQRLVCVAACLCRIVLCKQAQVRSAAKTWLHTCASGGKQAQVRSAAKAWLHTCASGGRKFLARLWR